MTYRYQRKLPDRIRDAWNMVAAPYPSFMIKLKPVEMLEPRDSTYEIEPVAAMVRTQAAAIEAEARAVAARETAILSGPLAGMKNSHFWDGDAAALFSLLQSRKPAKVVEIGCGNSTRIARKAIEDGALNTTLHCIDPVPRAEIAGFADAIERKSVLRADPNIFFSMQPGDFLFIDGSHYIFNGSDATYLFLEILPKLPAGVIVHVHDIMLPLEYHDVFSSRHYNEQYLLAAFVISGLIKPVLPVYWANKQGWMGYGHSFWGETSATQ